MSKQLVWSVYKYDMNKCEITLYNVLNEHFVSEVLYPLKRKYLKRTNFDFEAFMDEVWVELLSKYCGRVEYEIMLSDVFSMTPSLKIDIWSQINANWVAFSDYLLNNYKLIKKENNCGV